MNAPTSTTNEYLLLFRGQDWDREMSPAKTQEVLDRAMAWYQSIDTRGKVRGTNALERVGSIVTGKNGQIVTDGPFAESKEAIGGYLLIEASSLEEAVAIAKTCPTLEYGIAVEVRPTLSECPISTRLRARQVEAIA